MADVEHEIAVIIGQTTQQALAGAEKNVAQLLQKKNAYGGCHGLEQPGPGSTRWNMITYRTGKRSRL